MNLKMKAVTRLIALSAVATALAAGGETGERIVKGPVIGNVTPTGATLTWVTRKEVGTVLAPGNPPAPLAEETLHRVELTDLSPATRYSLSLDSAGEDRKAEFTTAPSAEAPFTFLVYGDTRTRHDVHTRVVERMSTEKPAFLLHTGDLVGNGLRPADWDKFFEISNGMLSRTPFFPVPGNHERNSPDFFRYFSFPGGNGHHFSFDWGAAHIVAIDTNEPGDSPGEKAAFYEVQLAWLRADLARNRKPLVVALFHSPLHTAMENRAASAARLAERYEPALVEGGVSIVFSGHDHNYQHHLVQGVHHVVTGGGGAPLYDVTPVPDVTVKAVKVEHYVRVKVSADGNATIEAVGLDGVVIDSFEVAPRVAVKKAA
jgi:acid phosphatase type 7